MGRLLLVVLFGSATVALWVNFMHSPKYHEARNECFDGVHWEQCGASGEQPPTADAIHKPAKGCPVATYDATPGFFTEGDGTPRDACISRFAKTTGNVLSIDLLYGGESASMTMAVPAPPTHETRPMI